VTLDRDVTPGAVGLYAAGRGHKSRVELEGLTIWSAKELPMPRTAGE
jgi:hypothetical protein